MAELQGSRVGRRPQRDTRNAYVRTRGHGWLPSGAPRDHCRPDSETTPEKIEKNLIGIGAAEGMDPDFHLRVSRVGRIARRRAARVCAEPFARARL